MELTTVYRPAARQILLGVQALLDQPNASDPAQSPAYDAFTKDRAAYEYVWHYLLRLRLAY